MIGSASRQTVNVPMSAEGSPLRILELTKWFGETCAINALTLVVPNG